MSHGHNGGLAGAMVTTQGPGIAKATEPMGFTMEQRAMIRDTFANGASESEFAVLLEVASARRLNPLLRQIHFVKRWDSQKKREVWSTQAAIDGLRAIAQRTGLYGGQDEPEFIEDGGRITCCKVRVYRKDWMRPSVGVAYWKEYVQTTREGAPTRFWQQMPHVMLAKCAEALALRKAFPEDMSGLYVPEEMAQADNVVPVLEPEPPQPTLDASAFAALTDRVDRAESGAELNDIAKDCMRARRSGAIGETQLDLIAAGVRTKRALIGAPKPPKSDPQVNDYDANEAEAEALASEHDR